VKTSPKYQQVRFKHSARDRQIAKILKWQWRHAL